MSSNSSVNRYSEVAGLSGRRKSGAAGMFVGLMFLGLGVGMLFGEPGAGVIIGMGMGFLATSFIKGVERGYTLRIPKSVGGVVVGLIGVSFILLGLEMLGVKIVPEAYAKLLAGVVIILVGLALLAVGLKKSL